MASDSGGRVSPLDSSILSTSSASLKVEGWSSDGTLCWSTYFSVGPPPLPGKKGACLTMRPEGQPGSWVDHMPRLISLNPYWSYSWSSTPVTAHPSDIEFLPMLWGDYGNLTERISQIMAMDPPPRRILGFNEPDHLKQSNIPVARAVKKWTQSVVPPVQLDGTMRKTISLVSPSPAHPGDEWMRSFMAAPGVSESIDWVGVHWYRGPDVAKFQTDMEEYYNLYGRRPLLLTEFAVADWTAGTVEENKYSSAQVLRFMQQVLPWLEETPWIAGYSWFSFPTSSAPGAPSALFLDNGELTPLGRYYASVRSA